MKKQLFFMLLFVATVFTSCEPDPVVIPPDPPTPDPETKELSTDVSALSFIVEGEEQSFEITTETDVVWNITTAAGVQPTPAQAQEIQAGAELMRKESIAASAKILNEEIRKQFGQEAYERAINAPKMEIYPIEIAAAQSMMTRTTVDWLTVTPNTGTGSSSVKVVALPNSDTAMRTATLFIKADGAEEVSISITQAGVTAPDPDEIIVFEDENFKTALLDEAGLYGPHIPAKIDANGDGEISRDEAALVTQMIVSMNFISSVPELEHFPNLILLSCYGNTISEIDVRSLVKLEMLSVATNLLTEIDVTNNTELLFLQFDSNEIPSVDISNNTKLQEFRCPSTLVTELDLSKNTDLVFVQFDFSKLQSLDISNNTKLKSLGCSWMTETFNTEIDLSNNLDLERLNVACNNMPALDISKNTNLVQVDCGINVNERDNMFATLDVSNLSKLTYLVCIGHQITALDLSNCTKLQTLWCGFNQIESIDLSNNVELLDLWIAKNFLTSLDVSANTKLIILKCYWNQFDQLDVTNNVALIAPNNLLCGGQTEADLTTAKQLTLSITQTQNDNGILADDPFVNSNVTLSIED